MARLLHHLVQTLADASIYMHNALLTLKLTLVLLANL